MRLRTFGFGLVLALISSAAYAQTQTYQLINGIKVEAVAVSSASRTSTGTVLQGIQFRAQSGTTPPKFYQRAVDFTKGTTAGSIKNFAKGNAFQLGLTAAILGMGWAMDELTGQIYSVPETSSLACASGSSCALIVGAIGISPVRCSPPMSISCAQKSYDYYCKQRPPTDNQCNPTTLLIVTSVTNNGSNSAGLIYANKAGSARNSSWGVSTVTQDTYTPETQAVPATDIQIADSITPQLTNDQLKKLHTDPVTGAIQQPQEVLNKMTEVANQYARELNPNSVNATAPTAVAIPGVTELPATDSLPQTVALDLPDFCTWATTVCEYMDWTKEMPTEPVDSEFTVASLVDETEVNLESYSSGLGSGSCPSPESLVLLGNTYNFSWQPACSLATGMSMLLIAGAYLSSIFILLGIRR